ncbi:MAG: PorP/SprF family type IX secretion system membrane protein [Saprospiraceae bacterium]|nr:PorP/SprF family type IX secretion system membrane protein [Saprospiraceae bacterium]
MKHLLLVILALSASICLSQQLPDFGLYREYQSFLNPASLPHDYFREDLNAQIGLSYRSQWNRFGDGSPVTGILHGTYIGDQSTTKLTLGGNLIFDKTGPINYLGMNAKIGVLFSEDPLYGGFSAALTIGLKQMNIQKDKLRAQNLPEILASIDVFKSYTPDIGIGIYYHARLANEDNFYTGLSMPQLFSINGLNSITNANITALPHYYGMVGYIKYLNDYSFLETTGWVRYIQNVPIHIDANLKYQLDQTLWLGVGASNSKVIHLEAGVVLYSNIGLETPIRISYSYEDGFNAIANPFGNTHEVSLSYAWDTRR